MVVSLMYFLFLQILGCRWNDRFWTSTGGIWHAYYSSRSSTESWESCGAPFLAAEKLPSDPFTRLQEVRIPSPHAMPARLDFPGLT